MFNNTILVLILTIIIQINNCVSIKNDSNVLDIYKIVQDINLYSNLELQKNIKNLNISEECSTDLTTIINSVKETWALKLIDSSAKSIPSGLLEGNVVDMGNYEECLSAENKERTIKGKYCVGVMQIKVQTDEKVSLMRGICMPNKCSSVDINIIMYFIIQTIGAGDIISFGALDGLCSTEESYNFRVSDWITISVVLLIFFWILVCTALDTLKPNITAKFYVFRAFSLYYNGGKLFKITTPAANSKVITCLNGLRVISILWIIMDHRFFLNYMFPFNINHVSTVNYLKTLPSTYAAGGTVSVDTFFIMSGFLLTLTFLKQIDRLNGKIPWVMFYVHRYIRLTVGLLAVLIFTLTIAIKIGRGPFWNAVLKQGLINFCEENWWSSLLYTQNYLNPDKTCLGHTWYLTVDMQLYVISPLLLYPMWRWKKFAYICVPILFVILHISTYLIVYYRKLAVKFLSMEASTEDILAWNKYYYQTSHTRAITWLMGVLLGYYIYNIRVPKRLNKIFVIFMWIVSLSLLVAVVMTVYPFIQDDHDLDRVWDPIYIVFSRTLWSIGVCWVIYACYSGYGGPINWFLSLNMWIPLCRISYCLYLIHMIEQLMKVASSETVKYFTPFNTLFETFGDVVLTTFLATCCYLCFECPIFNLESWLIKRASNSNRRTRDNIEGITSSTQVLT